MNPEEKVAWMRQRIRQLRNQLDEISGGEAVFGSSEENPDLPLEVELQFLEQVVGFETAAETTWREKPRRAGCEMPPPDSLDDEAVSFEVWQVIQRLSELRAYPDSTNHAAGARRKGQGQGNRETGVAAPGGGAGGVRDPAVSTGADSFPL